MFTTCSSVLGQFYQGFVAKKAAEGIPFIVNIYGKGCSAQIKTLRLGHAQKLRLSNHADEDFVPQVNTMYRPDPGMATIDFVWYDGDIVWLFQSTLARGHEMKASCIQCCQLLFAGKRLCFVFVVPSEDRGETLCQANADAFVSSTSQPGVSKRPPIDAEHYIVVNLPGTYNEKLRALAQEWVPKLRDAFV